MPFSPSPILLRCRPPPTRLSAEIIRKRLDYWTLIVGPKFSKADRQAIHLKRHYSIQQVEYCRNLIFRRNFPIHKLFERSCDLSLLRLLPDKITQIFGFRIGKKLHGKLQSVLEKVDHGHHVFRACGRNAVLRMYEKFSTFLRLEALSNNLKDFGLKKSLENLAAIRHTLAAITDRFAAFEAEALNVQVDFPLFQRLALPVTIGRARVPGIKIHDTRMIRLREVLLHSGTNIGGWRTAQIHEAILAAFGLKASHYTLTQLRYDLRKMKAHGLLERDESATLTGSLRKGTRAHSYSCSSTNAYVGRLPIVCSIHHRKQNSNPPPGSRPPIEKLIDPFNRFSISSLPDIVREKSSDQSLKNLRAEKRKAEIGFVSQEMKLSRARQQAAAEARKQELHKWQVLRTQAEVDHRILLNVNLQTPEHPITVGPQHIIAAEKAA